MGPQLNRHQRFVTNLRFCTLLAWWYSFITPVKVIWQEAYLSFYLPRYGILSRSLVLVLFVFSLNLFTSFPLKSSFYHFSYIFVLFISFLFLSYPLFISFPSFSLSFSLVIDQMVRNKRKSAAATDVANVEKNKTNLTIFNSR